MGTLLGHALPGSFFLLFACWRLLQICYRLRLIEFIKRRALRDREKHITFFTSASYPCCLALCAKLPLEGIVKILVTSVGMGGELWASTDYGQAGKILWMGDIQHVTMYGMFCISGIVDILWWQRVKICPPGLDFLALANAFLGELILFSHHLHGRVELDVQLHTLLLYVIAATVLSIIAEYKYDKSLIAALATTYLLFVQGTWFIQVGVILYRPMRWTGWLKFDLVESDQVVMASTIFAWHLGGVFVLVTVLYFLIRYFLRFSCHPMKWEKLWDAQLKSSGSRSFWLPLSSPDRHSVTSTNKSDEEIEDGL